MTQHKWYFFSVILLLMAVSLSACGGGDVAVSEVYSLAPASSLNDEIRAAPVGVQEAYRFAIANPAILEQIPCYCGCGSVGHKNNYQCYVSAIGTDGKPIFDNHALG